MSKNIENFGRLRVDALDATYEFAPGAGTFEGQSVAVYLDDLEASLLAWLSKQEAVVGCVAWLTNEKVLNALNSLKICQVVMQKEDWMRPDYDGRHPARHSRKHYDGEAGFCRLELAETIGLSTCGDPSVDRFRCFGQSTSAQTSGPMQTAAPPARPVMHHKFLVGCAMQSYLDDGYPSLKLIPRSVWMGSFNMTKGARRNMDSAVVMGAGPAALYYREWLDVFSHSERLDFDYEYCVPEWRLGS